MSVAWGDKDEEQIELIGTLTSSIKEKQRCHYCNKLGHFKKECEEFAKVKGHSKPVQAKKKTKMGPFKVTNTTEEENYTDSESTDLVAKHAILTESNALL